jgi:predicted DNA-binding transcriptional regulator AlpA
MQTSDTQPVRAIEPLLTVEDLMKVFPMMSRWSVYRLVGHGDIPHVRIGRRIYFDPAAVRRYIADRGVGDAP